MNAGVTEETAAGSVPERPGARLKTVRETRGLDLARAAALLHLSEDKLEALEADDYRDLPGSVFVQGYLRNYARLLGVPVEPLLNAYRELGGGQEAQPNLRIARVRHEVGSSHGLVRLMTWGIVIGLIALVVIWWRGYLQWPLQRETVFVETPREAVESAEVAPDGMVLLPPLPDMATDFSSEINDRGEASLALPGSGSSSAQEPEAAGTEGDRGAVGVETAPPPTPGEVPTAVSVGQEVVSNDPASALQTVGGDQRIVLEFDGDSWTEIRDSSGTFKIMGAMNAGSRRVLGGAPPYKVVLGNASVVRILVDGEAFDLTPFIRGNVARFTLDPD